MIDKKYRKSFGIYDKHQCVVSGLRSSEYSESVVGCHLSLGNYGRGMKASDLYIIPLCDRLHREFDANQMRFLKRYSSCFGIDYYRDEKELLFRVRLWTCEYYLDWFKERQ